MGYIYKAWKIERRYTKPTEQKGEGDGVQGIFGEG